MSEADTEFGDGVGWMNGGKTKRSYAVMDLLYLSCNLISKTKVIITISDSSQ